MATQAPPADAPAAAAAPEANGNSAATETGEKRPAETPAGEPQAKVAKTDGGEGKKEEKKEKEKEKDKGDKEKKEKKDKGEKDKDKDKKDKKEKDKDKKKDKDKDKKEKGDKDKPAKALTRQDSNVGGSGGKVLDQLDHRRNFKEGQKNLTPPVADATRAFYTSLMEENPDSKIAIKWCIESGVLPLEQHNKLLKKYNYMKDKGQFSMQAQIKKAIEKKIMKSMGRSKGEAKDKKEKKEGKEGKEKKEEKEKKEKKEAAIKIMAENM